MGRGAEGEGSALGPVHHLQDRRAGVRGGFQQVTEQFSDYAAAALWWLNYKRVNLGEGRTLGRKEFQLGIRVCALAK